MSGKRMMAAGALAPAMMIVMPAQLTAQTEIPKNFSPVTDAFDHERRPARSGGVAVDLGAAMLFDGLPTAHDLCFGITE